MPEAASTYFRELPRPQKEEDLNAKKQKLLAKLPVGIPIMNWCQLTPKILTPGKRSDIMNSLEHNFDRVPKDRQDVEAYLAKLQYALQNESTLIEFQEERLIDHNRQEEYTNKYTIAKLFPDESPKDVIRKELASLEVREYIETVKDTRYPRRSEFWVFGKQYQGRDVYIKFRVEIIQKDYIFVMSFHFSTIPFSKVHFPFAEEGG